ncbi:MAG: TPM domain-containing protein [Proteobacteria bacterium]|nr:TPM domain-containing protein [Pseudomonadota bacterium]
MATPSPGLVGRFKRLLRHRWTDEATLRRALPPEALARIGERVTASERRHSGQIRVCIEAGLPWSYIRRDAPARQRAITLFGKLRVWDTAQNNGVLIYLLLAEHAIEIVADRGIDLHVDAADWAAMAKRMAQAFREGRFEDGVTQALEEVSALLVEHFPAEPGVPSRRNELPDAPVVLL